MKVCGASFVNAAEGHGDLTPMCDYSPEAESSYWDAEWHYDIGHDLGIPEDWYGMDKWWTSKIF